MLVVVTFHSLEDKIVKYFFKSLSEQKSISRYTPVTEQPETLLKLNEKKAIVPSDEEIKENLPSRSAKLRYAIKKDDFYDFETDIFDQFKNLIEIEELWRQALKKIIVATVIFLLIISTALIKNSAKKNEDKIFTLKENLRVLNS